MDILLYRPLVMIRNAERAFRPVWMVQKRNIWKPVSLYNVLAKAFIRIRRLDIQEKTVVYASRERGPAFLREISYLSSVLPFESFKSAQTRKGFISSAIFLIELLLFFLPNSMRFIGFAKRLRNNSRITGPEFEKYLFFLADFLVYKYLFNTKNKRPRGVVAHTLFSPRELALLSAALSDNIPSLFILHGACSGRKAGIYFPTFPVALHMIKSQASYDGIGFRFLPETRFFFYGLPVNEEPLRIITEHPRALGICLTYAVTVQELDPLLEDLKKILKPETIRIRFHPRDPLGFTYKRQNIQVSVKDETIQDFARQCELVIAGNTSAILEILKSGCPVIYLATLDALGDDVYGFVEKGIVPGFSDVKDISIEDGLKIYGEKGWANSMAYFDPSYGKERQKIDDKMREAILAVLDGA